jgi:mRNA interferase HigB
MKILIKKTLHYFINKYPTAEKQLNIWHNDFSEMDFSNFNELKKVYGNSSILNNNRVVFNIKGNDYRLIVSLNFLQGTCYLIWFGTHNEYNKIDCETVPFDKDILKFIKK